MTRILLIAIIGYAVLGVAATLWIVGRAPATSGDFLTASQEYSTSGGQELQPRWSASEESADAPAN